MPEGFPDREETKLLRASTPPAEAPTTTISRCGISFPVLTSQALTHLITSATWPVTCGRPPGERLLAGRLSAKAVVANTGGGQVRGAQHLPGSLAADHARQRTIAEHLVVGAAEAISHVSLDIRLAGDLNHEGRVDTARLLPKHF